MSDLKLVHRCRYAQSGLVPGVRSTSLQLMKQSDNNILTRPLVADVDELVASGGRTRLQRPLHNALLLNWILTSCPTVQVRAFLAMFTATRLQVATYLLGVCPFSIAFLVFLNSSVSFIITDLIGQTHRVGDAVGTLGFADELLAIVACPLWGLLSDRIGLRFVRPTHHVQYV